MRSVVIVWLAVMTLWGGMQMSPGLYRELSEVQKLIEAKNFTEASAQIAELLGESEAPGELAFIYQAKGYLELEMEAADKAKASFEKALSLNILEGTARLNILQNLGALCIQDGEYDKGIAYLLDWLKATPKPHPGVHITLATAYVKQEKLTEALHHAKTAVSLSEEPKESWYALLSALYYQKGELDSAAKTLETMLKLFGIKKNYLSQLFGIRMQQEDHKEALAIWSLADRSGLLEKKEELEQLAMLYGVNGVPLEAARVLVRGMDGGSIPEDLEHLQLCYEYFLGAKEYETARIYLAKAAELAEDGKLYVQYGQLLFEAEEYEMAAKAFERALKKGALNHLADVWMLSGISLYESGRESEAKASFKKAAEFEKNRAAAQSWVNFLESRE